MADKPRAEKEVEAAATAPDTGASSAPEESAADTLTGEGRTGEIHVAGGEAEDHLVGPENATDSDDGGLWSADRIADGTEIEITPAPELADGPAGEKDDPLDARTGSGGTRHRLAIWLILLLLIGGGGYATYPIWRAPVAPYAALVGLDLPAISGVEATDPASAPGMPPPADPASGTPEVMTADPAPAPSTAADPESRIGALESVPASTSDGGVAPPAQVPDPVAAELADLDARLSSLESKLTALSDEMAIIRQGLGEVDGTDGVGALAADLSARLQHLTSRLETLETAPPPSTNPAVLDGLEQRLSGLEGAQSGAVDELASQLAALTAEQNRLATRIAAGRDAREKAGAFLLAVNHLASVTAASGGFQAELDAVRLSAPEDGAVAGALAALAAAADGVASLAALRVGFPAVAAAALDASVVGSGDGVVGTALLRIASLVTVRRTETVEGDDIDALLNRAEAALGAGDLDGAVAAIGGLDGDAGAAVAEWLAAARARLAVDGAVRTLQARALSGVSASGVSGG